LAGAFKGEAILNDQPIRIAVIGAGKIAELGHLPGYVAAGARLVALCDRTPETLNRLAQGAAHINR
jgi:predicted dehydrogenase